MHGRGLLCRLLCTRRGIHMPPIHTTSPQARPSTQAAPQPLTSHSSHTRVFTRARARTHTHTHLYLIEAQARLEDAQVEGHPVPVKVHLPRPYMNATPLPMQRCLSVSISR